MLKSREPVLVVLTVYRPETELTISTQSNGTTEMSLTMTPISESSSEHYLDIAL